MATELQRQHLHGLMHWLVAENARIGYVQLRPMRTVHFHEQELVTLFAGGHTISMDCSEGVTLLCKLAGLADPNGLGYSGQGFTGTLLDHLPHYTDPKQADVGALVVFGPGSGHHVCMVAETDTRHGNPLLWSQGQQADPSFIRLHDMQAGQPAPTTLLNVSKL